MIYPRITAAITSSVAVAMLTLLLYNAVIIAAVNVVTDTMYMGRAFMRFPPF